MSQAVSVEKFYWNQGDKYTYWLWTRDDPSFFFLKKTCFLDKNTHKANVCLTDLHSCFLSGEQTGNLQATAIVPASTWIRSCTNSTPLVHKGFPLVVHIVGFCGEQCTQNSCAICNSHRGSASRQTCCVVHFSSLVEDGGAVLVMQLHRDALLGHGFIYNQVTQQNLSALGSILDWSLRMSD